MDYIMIITDVSVDHEYAHILIVALSPEGIYTVDVSRLIRFYKFLICSPMNWLSHLWRIGGTKREPFVISFIGCFLLWRPDAFLLLLMGLGAGLCRELKRQIRCVLMVFFRPCEVVNIGPKAAAFSALAEVCVSRWFAAYLGYFCILSEYRYQNQSHKKLCPAEGHLFSQGRSSLVRWLSFHGSYSQCD